MLLGIVTLILVAAMPAAAHVTVQPEEAVKGGFALLAFRVPNESATAGTVKLAVGFPQDTPLASVRIKPMNGWTAAISKETLATPIKTDDGEITQAVRGITWTAQPGVRIGPDEFTEFEVSVGPLPNNADRLLFPTVQTYDDGRVVSWDQPPPANGAQEPEHPAPALRLVAPSGDQNAAGSTATGAAGSTTSGNGVESQASGQSAQAARSGQSAQAAQSGHDDTARWLAGAALAAAALGLGVAGGALLAGRQRRQPPAD
jgi:uncharacterized protein YcnI